MTTNFSKNVGTNYEIVSGENVFSSLFREYERVIFESIFTSFGLDFIIKDQHGGDVDTVHNVRQIGEGKGKDPQMTWKNKNNEKAYNERGKYNRYEYHDKNTNYQNKIRDTKANAKNGVITDAYTGQDIVFSRHAPANKKAALDHVIAACTIHEDQGRVLAGLDGTELANADENLEFINSSLNSSMGKRDIPDYLENPPKNRAVYDNLTDEDKKRMMEHYEKAKSAYDKKINRAYYTSPKFLKDTAKAAGAVGVQMGLRQALGFFFMNVWFSIKDEFEEAEIKPSLNLDLGDFFKAIGTGVQKGFEKTMSVEGLRKLLEGGFSGILSSLTTTICNIFFATAKNVVKIIRQSYASIVQAATVLFINPDNYLLGDRMIAVAKIIATGASVVVGSLVSTSIEATPIGKIPVVGDIVQAFLGSLVTGVMSCTLLLFLDRSETARRFSAFLNDMDMGIDRELAYIKQQAEFFKDYAAELEKIDIENFRKETNTYASITDRLIRCDDEKELNNILLSITKELPWTGDFPIWMDSKEGQLAFR